LACSSVAVKGAYFAILSQALAAALAILLVGQTSVGGAMAQQLPHILRVRAQGPGEQRMLYFIAAAVLLIVWQWCAS